MTPLRLAIIIVNELHSAGFISTNNVNGPANVAVKAIQRRIDFGDVTCTPDEDELYLEQHGHPHTDGHGDGDE